ncbi:hypothetical protein [Lentzea sp. NPDC051838]|uniref:TolB family protein n=1 Tax=Lentzea sp. NPDC051838 TaxID=3154849 RepID=UPI0034182FE9
MRSRLVIALAATVLLLGAAAAYALLQRHSDANATSGVRLDAGGLLVRSTANGHLAKTSNNEVTTSGLECARVYAAGGTGVCLGPALPGTYQATVLDAASQPTRTVPLDGVPSRARVSASGRMISWTVFVAGDSYNRGAFSTRSGVLDTRTGDLAGNLETFGIDRDGQRYTADDVNFWGVTFAADDNRFYATLATDGHHFLVEGDFANRTVRTVHDGVECPSLSPDGKRIAFKKRVGDGWRLSVLSLDGMTETPLAETRSVDDQPAWLDDHTIGYGLPRADPRHSDVWTVPADGSGAPELLVEDAESPAPLPAVS